MTEEMLGLDPLTGLPNYWYMLRELERHIAVYKRYRHPFSLLLLHFDNLKGVKDTWGDTVGNVALAYLATLIQTHVRASDICCQHTEDEFAVIMPETNRHIGEALGHRITDSVVPTTFEVGEASVSVKMSFGIASCPRDGAEAEALLRAASARERISGAQARVNG
jgi:diguanylate cyclase (GGDEF)-like protein